MEPKGPLPNSYEPPRVLILSQNNPIHAPYPIYDSLSSYLRLGLPSGLLSLISSLNTCMHSSLPPQWAYIKLFII